MTPRIAHVTEAQVRRSAGKKVFERGAAYYRERRVQDPQAEGSEIRGRVFGEPDEPYRVCVEAKRGHLDSECTCPYEGDFCKHAVALLLHWIYRPREFTQVESLRDRLRKMEKEELVELLVRGARRDPQLIPRGPPSNISPAGLRRQILDTFHRYSDRHGFVPYERVLDLVDALDPFQRMAGERGKKGQPMEAARILQTLFTTCIENIEQVDDSGGSLGGFIGVTIEDCGRWARKSGVPADERMIRGILELYLGPGDDFGFVDDLGDLLLQICVPGNREAFEKVLRDEFRRRQATLGKHPQSAQASERLQSVVELQESAQAKFKRKSSKGS